MKKFDQILFKYWGFRDFRPLQREIIESVYNGNDTLALMPTGGGKSVTFQVPALAMDGICLVVTPLIALMRDQVEDLQSRGIKAMAIYSGMIRNEIETGLENCIFGNYKFLYVSPERLTSSVFQYKLREMNVCLLAVDESHCISQWGYDFRPSYLNISMIRKFFPDTAILALTATATSEVAEDIMDNLKFRKKNILKKSFDRPNLVYIVRTVEDKNKYILKIVRKVKGSGIIYSRNRRSTREISGFLNKQNVIADYYHAGLGQDLRKKKEGEWKSGKTRIIVSTNAFGMGIDKADVRFVVHMDAPDSLESYYQEAGRCGRDGKTSYAVLLYNNSDKVRLKKNLTVSFPEIDKIKTVYQALCNYFRIIIGSGKGQVFDIRIGDFASRYGFSIMTAFNSLKLLEREGFIELTDELNTPSKLHFIVNRQALYEFQVANADFDILIKMVLRSYTGLFTDYVRIDEQFLSNKLKRPPELIKEILKKLTQSKIVSYIPGKKTPQVIFTSERLDNKSLFISRANYDLRKKQNKKRVDSILIYSTSEELCRSKILLNYFGEKTEKNCGHCDICMEKEEINLSNYEFKLIEQAVKDKLEREELLPEELCEQLLFTENKVLKVLQWLIDNGSIRMQINQKLSLK